ncbi:MAG: succinic semialdehyde dehydrogenase [Aggregatilineales bacterium]
MAAVKRTTAQQARHIEVINPITGRVIDRVPEHTPEEVAAAVAEARAAQPAWEAMGLERRLRLLRRWADLVYAERRTAVEIIRAETGKTEPQAQEEILVIDATVAYYYYTAPKLLRPRTRRSLLPLLQKARVYYKPFGVVGVISPWNFPLLLAFLDMIPALIAGNTVVLKPSEATPLTARWGADLMYRAGIPHNVVQIVNGAGQTGAALVDTVDYVMFTGSTAVGRKIAARAGERLIPYSMELGGKDPAIIRKDADLDQAAKGLLLSALAGAGQICISTERVYVEKPIYDAFLARLCWHIEQFRVGPGDDLDTHMGSLTSERELLRVEAQIADAVAKGAKVIFGGRRRPDLGPLFFEPTILVDVDHSMLVMQEETFGPLIPIMKVKDADEAVRLANDSEYGLSGLIYTRDLRQAEALATRLQSGDVAINRPQWVWGTLAAPMGGSKPASGVGRRNGPEGLMRFVQPQSIVIDNAALVLPQDYMHLTRWLRFLYEVRRRLIPYVPFLRS